MKAISLASCVFILLSACARDLTETDLIGVYVANFGAGGDTIELRADGTYLHQFQQPGASTVKNEGSWSISLDRDKKQWITFREFVWAPNTRGAELRLLSGGVYEPTMWITPVYRVGKGVRLVANDDIGQYYVKEKSDGKP